MDVRGNQDVVKEMSNWRELILHSLKGSDTLEASVAAFAAYHVFICVEVPPRCTLVHA